MKNLFIIEYKMKKKETSKNEKRKRNSIRELQVIKGSLLCYMR